MDGEPAGQASFSFPAEDGIRAADVTGVQTCALPISGVQLTKADPVFEGTLGIIRNTHFSLQWCADQSHAAKRPQRQPAQTLWCIPVYQRDGFARPKELQRGDDTGYTSANNKRVCSNMAGHKESPWGK